MEIRVSTRHGHISEETQARVTSKVEKLTRLFDRLTTIEITVGLERRDLPSIDLKVSAEHKHDLRIQGRHRNSGGQHQEVSTDWGPAIG